MARDDLHWRSIYRITLQQIQERLGEWRCYMLHHLNNTIYIWSETIGTHSSVCLAVRLKCRGDEWRLELYFDSELHAGEYWRQAKEDFIAQVKRMGKPYGGRGRKRLQTSEKVRSKENQWWEKWKMFQRAYLHCFTANPHTHHALCWTTLERKAGTALVIPVWK